MLALAAAAVALYVFVARGARFHTLREVAWIFAASQLIAVIVPVLWEVAKFFAVVILVADGGPPARDAAHGPPLVPRRPGPILVCGGA